MEARWRVGFCVAVCFCLLSYVDQAAMFVLRAGEGERQAVAAAASGMFEPPRYWTEMLGSLLQVEDCRQPAMSSLLSRRTRARYRYVYTVTVRLVGSYGRYP